MQKKVGVVLTRDSEIQKSTLSESRTGELRAIKGRRTKASVESTSQTVCGCRTQHGPGREEPPSSNHRREQGYRAVR